jgi:hypothetical protein
MIASGYNRGRQHSRYKREYSDGFGDGERKEREKEKRLILV